MKLENVELQEFANIAPHNINKAIMDSQYITASLDQSIVELIHAIHNIISIQILQRCGSNPFLLKNGLIDLEELP